MKKKRTAQLRRQVASTRRISVSAPACPPAREDFRSSLGEGGLLNLCGSIGLAVFFFGLLFAMFARSDRGRVHLKSATSFVLVRSSSTRSKLLAHPTAEGEHDTIVVPRHLEFTYNRSFKKTP